MNKFRRHGNPGPSGVREEVGYTKATASKDAIDFVIFFAIINYIYVRSGVIIEKLGWRYLFYFPGILSVLSGKHNSYTDIN